MKNPIITLLFLLLPVTMMGQSEKFLESHNYQCALEAIGNDRFDEALDYLNKEIKEHKNNGYAYSWLAYIMRHMKEYDRALEYSNMTLRLLPKKETEFRVTTLLIRAETNKALGQNDKALADYNQAVKEAPDYYLPYSRRASLYSELGDFDLSDKDYHQSIRLRNDNPVAYVGLGTNAVLQKRWDDAVTQFNRALLLSPDNAYVMARRAECFIGKQDYDKAADDIVRSLDIDRNQTAFELMVDLGRLSLPSISSRLEKKADAEPENKRQWLYYLAICYETTDNFNDAIRLYKQVIDIEPTCYTSKRISCCYRELGDYDKALEHNSKALELFDPDSDNDYNLLKDRARYLLGMGKMEEAKKVMDEFIAENPDNASGYYTRGVARDNSNDYDGAIEDYTKALALNPKMSSVYLLRGNLYRLKGNNDLAMADYRKLTETGRDDDACFGYYYLGNKEKAMELMKKVLEGDDYIAHYVAAGLYSVMNEKEVALHHLRKALEGGYRAFVHISHNRAFDNISGEKAFQELIREFREKYEKERLTRQ